MALPEDVTTFELTFGPYTDAAGEPVFAGMTGKIKPSFPQIRHVASGAVVIDSPIPVVIDGFGVASVQLAHTDQAVLSPVGFTYSVVWDVASRKPSPGNKQFAVPTSAGAEVDFDLLAPSPDVEGIVVPLTYGKSAYDLAVENGFVGTEDAWLASLVDPEGLADPVVSTLVSNTASATAVALRAAFVPGLLQLWDGDDAAANNSRLDWEHNWDKGYLLHLHTGAGMTGGSLIALGVGDGGNAAGGGLLVSQKAASAASAIALLNAAGTTGKMLNGTHLATGGTNPFFYLETANTTGVATPLLQLVANGTPGTGQVIQSWKAPKANGGANGGAELMVFGDTGELRSSRAPIRARLAQVISDASANGYAALDGTDNTNPSVRFGRYTGSAGQVYGSRLRANNTGLQLELASAASGIGAEVYDTVALIADRGAAGVAKLGFFGAAAVVRRTHTPDATDLASAITAVNALLADVRALGLKAAA